MSIGFAVLYVSRALTGNAEQALQRSMIEAGTVVDQQCATLVQTMAVNARLVADLPRLKAALDLGDPPTVAPIARDYRLQLGAALLVLTDRNGRVMAVAGDPGTADSAIPLRPEVEQALRGRESTGAWPVGDGVLQVVSVPVTIGPDEILGTLTVGVRLDEVLAQQFRRVTESEIAFAVDGQVRASTLPLDDTPKLAPLLGSEGVQPVQLSAGEYVALRRPLITVLAPPGLPVGQPSQPAAPAGEPVSRQTSQHASQTGQVRATVLLLRSRTDQLRFLGPIRNGLWLVGIIAVFAATIMSYAVARTVTRPLAAITDAMREMSATGDLSRKLARRGTASWADEDAAILASTFDSLTDALAGFQREAAQEERLSALGRLSTVIAHEVRNPLMIIKTSLRAVGREGVSRDEIAQALDDVNEEVARLNRVVNDVLDFAKPIRFDLEACDVNAVCASAEAAARADGEVLRVALRLDPALGPIVTDGERLRGALVNVITNARHAVLARRAREETREEPGTETRTEVPDVEVLTAPTAVNGVPGVRITVRDAGTGVSAEELPRLFDPYFTTKRAGTGLGLAIVRNVIEGLGGSIAVTSRSGGGTVLQIELPSRGESR